VRGLRDEFPAMLKGQQLSHVGAQRMAALLRPLESDHGDRGALVAALEAAYAQTCDALPAVA
jgi:hypothetical protein